MRRKPGDGYGGSTSYPKFSGASNFLMGLKKQPVTQSPRNQLTDTRFDNNSCHPYVESALLVAKSDHIDLPFFNFCHCLDSHPLPICFPIHAFIPTAYMELWRLSCGSNSGSYSRNETEEKPASSRHSTRRSSSKSV